MKLTLSPLVPPQEAGEAVAALLQAGAPYVHVEGLGFAGFDSAERDTYVRTAASAIGELTLTDGKPGTEVWELNSATSPNASRIPYHTDNPFYDSPEEVVGFWNIRSSIEGGENLILPGSRLVEHMSTTTPGRDLLEELKNKQVRFMRGDKDFFGPLVELGSGLVMLRFDSKDLTPNSEDQDLAARFSQVLEGADLPADRVKLAAGEAIFFNNRQVLHARAPYSDPSRLSLRTRSQSIQRDASADVAAG
jgi:hypothetical protein